MIPDLEYIRTNDLKEALQLLENSDGKIRLIAGGTDIVPGFQQGSLRFAGIEKLLDINRVDELKSFYDMNNRVEIGAGVTFSEIISNEIIANYFPLLVKAASTIGSVQIRNSATIGGNIVNNAPCADSLSPLLVYDAKLRIQSSSKTKEILLKDFLSEAYHTQLEHNEIVTHIILPKISNSYVGDFYKLGRRRGIAISRLSLTVLLRCEDQIIEDLRIAGGAVTPVAMRFEETEQKGKGKRISNELLVSLSQEIGKTVLKVTGLRWSSAYKLPVVQQSLYQLIVNILGKSENTNAA
jgi:CO/xanthine dehydrogenase FAD-binding subunit